MPVRLVFDDAGGREKARACPMSVSILFPGNMHMSDVFIAGADMIHSVAIPTGRLYSLAPRLRLCARRRGLSILDVEAVYAIFVQCSVDGARKSCSRLARPACRALMSPTPAPRAQLPSQAILGIKSGEYDVVLAVGAEKNPRGMLAAPPSDGPPAEGLFGSVSIPSVFAEAGMVHANRYGTTLEQFAKVAVKNHHHATMNPMAAYRNETPLEEVLASEMIAGPLTKMMCSANVDGAAAVMLVSEKKARELGMARMCAFAVPRCVRPL